MTRKHVMSLALVLSGAVAIASPSDAQPVAPKLPASATLQKPLGFRLAAGLGDAFVFPTRNYLPPATSVRLVSATGPLWTAGTYCQAEYGGRTGFVRCDDATALNLAPAPATTSGSSSGSSSASSSGSTVSCTNPLRWSRTDPVKGLKLCSDVDSCRSFCHCACAFDPKSNWTKNEKTDRTTRCSPLGVTGQGVLAPHSPDLKPLPSFSTIRVSADARATQPVIDGLKKLDASAATASWKSKYTVFVKSCYRPAEDDMKDECMYMLKADHILEKYKKTPPANPVERESLAWAESAQNVQNLGLAWPGANPHSGGVGCDIQMLDAKSNEALFEWRVEANKATANVHEASRALDEAVTKAGGKRLTYETWHYEWGGMSDSRCAYPDCDKFWPPKGSP